MKQVSMNVLPATLPQEGRQVEKMCELAACRTPSTEYIKLTAVVVVRAVEIRSMTENFL
jgi:hypothetical protein